MPFFLRTTSVQSEAVAAVAASLLETPGEGRGRGAGRWLSLRGRDRPGRTGWRVLAHSLWGRRGALNAVHKRESSCCPGKPIQGFPVPLASLAGQPSLLGEWVLMGGLLGIPLSPPSSTPHVQPLRDSQLSIIAELLSPLL